MAVHRPLMVFRDSRTDRIAMRPQQGPPPPQHPVAAAIAAAMFRTLPPHQRFVGRKEDGIGMMGEVGGGGGGVGGVGEGGGGVGGVGGPWIVAAAHERHRQRVMAEAALNRQRRQQQHAMPPPTLSGAALIRPEWDGESEWDSFRRNLRVYDSQQQKADASVMSRGFRAGRDESGHAELIARYGGDRSASFRELVIAHAALSRVAQPPQHLPRKRSRGDEADLSARERALRFRKLSALDGPAPPPVLPLTPQPSPAAPSAPSAVRSTVGKEYALPRVDYATDVRVDEDDHEDGQLTPPPPVISQQVPYGRAEKVRKQLFEQQTIQDGLIPHAERAETPAKAPAKAHAKSRSYDKGFTLLAGHGSALGSKPPNEKESRRRQGEHDPPPRWRASTPRFKDNERVFPFERARASDQVSVSSLTSELLDFRKLRAREDLEDRSGALNIRPQHRSDDGLRPTKGQQQYDIPTTGPRRDESGPLSVRGRDESGHAKLIAKIFWDVNPKAPYCEGFFLGNCKDGDECKKKHSYVLSVYVDRRGCPDQAIFQHPTFALPNNEFKSGTSQKRKRKPRYFSAKLSPTTQKMHIGDSGDNTVAVVDGDASKESGMDFISLNAMSRTRT